MIIFSWTLTPNQILALRSVADYQASYEKAFEERDVKTINQLRLDQFNMRSWFSSTRGLFKEGFIRHYEAEVPKWMRTPTMDPKHKRQVWEITEKGRLILQVVGIEIEEQSRTLISDKQTLKLLVA